MSIKVRELVKEYNGQKAVDGISFEVTPGQIVGFLGPNGAGKSTTMKILTGFLEATAGQAEVNGHDIAKSPLLAKRSVGYLPEHNPLYLDMYVREFLIFTGKLFGMGGRKLQERIGEVIRMCGLEVEKHKKIGQLSKGYRQRTGLAQALLHDPEVLILDEPTTGLDPNQLAEIRALIRTAGKDKTVLFSTHIMQEVEAVCDRVVMINRGKIVTDTSMESLRNSGDSLEEIFQRLSKPD